MKFQDEYKLSCHYISQ